MESYLQCNCLRTVSLSISVMFSLPTFSGYLIVNSFPARRTSTCRVFSFHPVEVSPGLRTIYSVSSLTNVLGCLCCQVGHKFFVKQLVSVSGDSKFLHSFKTISGTLLEGGNTTYIFCCPLTPLLLPILALSSPLNATLPFCGFKAIFIPSYLLFGLLLALKTVHL